MITENLNIFERFLRWQWLRVFFLFICGVSLVIFSKTTLFYKPHVGEQPKEFYYDALIPFIDSLGIAILSGGFFAFLMKSFQFIGMFRDEIRNMFTSQEILAHNKNGIRDLILCKDSLLYSTLEFKEIVWKNVTASIYQSSLSDIDEEVVSTIYEKYIPKKLEYYQKDFMINYEINKLDDHHVELIENQSYYIVSKAEKFKFERIYNVWREDDISDKSLLEFKEIQIDNVSYLQEVQYAPEQNKTENGKNFKLLKAAFVKEFSGNKTYKVRCRVRTVHSTRMNVSWRYELGKFTKGITVNVYFDRSKYSIGLEFFGKNIALEDNFVHLPSVSKTHTGLLMPSDSLMLIIDQL